MRNVTVQKAGDRLARLLLPYRVREYDAAEAPDHQVGWWERPNDQPPKDWLVAQAECRDGVLAGFVAPGGPASPRIRVDAIIVPCTASELAASTVTCGFGRIDGLRQDRGLCLFACFT
jgi:hypothetical protein